MSTPYERKKRNKRILGKIKQFNRAKRYVSRFKTLYPYTIEETNRVIKLYTETRQPCSCSSCGNPRKHFQEKTIQEIKFDISTKEELEELNENRETFKED